MIKFRKWNTEEERFCMSKKRKLSRREFLKFFGITGAGMALSACVGQPAEPKLTILHPTQTPMAVHGEPTVTEITPQSSQTYLAVTRGEDPAELIRRAVSALGGMERFVKKGDDVIIKPNICTDYHTFEYGATTNPEVVGMLVKMALTVGAKRVRVMDAPFGGTPESAYQKSGIADAVNAAGGVMEVMNPAKYAKTPIPQGIDLQTWWIYQDVLMADVLINVPIAKTHSLAKLTLGFKNLLGVIQDRPQMHNNLKQRLPDLASLIRPELTIVDGYRTMLSGGPTGGNLNDVKLTKTIIASPDMVAVDAYACSLFDRSVDYLPYLEIAQRMGLGTKDLSSIKIEEITV
jgi:uncharacterized protein (DUF362 family)